MAMQSFFVYVAPYLDSWSFSNSVGAAEGNLGMGELVVAPLGVNRLHFHLGCRVILYALTAVRSRVTLKRNIFARGGYGIQHELHISRGGRWSALTRPVRTVHGHFQPG